MKECEEVENLPANFRFALISWVVHRRDDTLCAAQPRRNLLLKTVKEPSITEIKVRLIPYDVFPKSLPDFQYNGFHEAHKTFTNVICVKPNRDILFTSYMCRSGIPKMPSKIYRSAYLGEFVRGESESQNQSVKIGIYINGHTVKSSDILDFSSYRSVNGTYFKSPQPLLNKNRKYRITFTLKVVSGIGIYDDVPVEKVNDYLEDSFDMSYFKDVFYEKPEKKTALFVSRLGFVPLN
jgi:hypothetical protein